MISQLQITGLPPLRLASRARQAYACACPRCGGDHHSDRFRVWPEQGRYWCRQCNARGWNDALTGDRPLPILRHLMRHAANLPEGTTDPHHDAPPLVLDTSTSTPFAIEIAIRSAAARCMVTSILEKGGTPYIPHP